MGYWGKENKKENFILEKYKMKNIIFIFSVLFVFQSMLLSAQSIAVNRTISFSYDLNGNITSRKGTSLPSKPIGGNEKTDISGDISIIARTTNSQ